MAEKLGKSNEGLLTPHIEQLAFNLVRGEIMYRTIMFFVIVFLIPCALAGQDRGIKVKARTEDGQILDLYSNSYALVIGVGAYTHWERLHNPVRDAHEVGKALEGLGFKVTSLDDPDAEQLKRALNTFAYGPAGTDEHGRVVVFFAGHGHTERTASEDRGFILPTDTPLPDVDRVGFMSKAVSMDDIKQLAKGMFCKHVLFVFDSCFSGTLLRGKAHPGPITRKTAKKVRQFITSGSANEQVPDHSQFKGALLNALDGDADKTGDGYVTGEELGWYLKGKVMEYSNGAQTPQYGKIRDPNLDQGDIVFELPLSPPPPVVSPKPPEKPLIRVQNLYGDIRITANFDGDLFYDGKKVGQIREGQQVTMEKILIGTHRIGVRGARYQWEDTVEVEEGKTAEARAEVTKPETGILKIETDPSGATVKIDGKARNISPCIMEVTTGEHKVAVLSPYPKRYPDFEKSVMVSKNDTVRIVHNFLEVPHGKPPEEPDATEVSLSISSIPMGARVFIDHEEHDVGVTPIQIELSSGEHRVRLSKKGYYPYEKTIVLRAGRTVDIIPELVPKEGSIDIRTEPSGATIYIDGIVKGLSPKAVKVLVGLHSIKLKPSYPTVYRSFEKDVTVKADRTVVIEHTFEKRK